MLELDASALTHFLQKAHWPVMHEQQPTFFSIAGIEQKELPLSNVYAFFFDSEEVHGLGPLFLQALLEVAGEKKPELTAAWPMLERPVRVVREYAVEKQQRLDLHDGTAAAVPHEASYAILIENKVNHWLANDLGNYLNSVRGSMRKLGVVLGVRRERPAEPWLFVSHGELAQAVQQRLGPLLSRVNARYLPVLLHFLEHLMSMSDQNDNFTQAFDFAQRHRAQLAPAQQLLAELTGQALGKAVVAALGEGFELQGDFENRVDIRLTQPAPLRYVVFFSHILDLSKPPGFTITLYVAGANKQQTAVWRQYLEAQPWVQQTGATRRPWFMYDALAIGKEYSFAGSSLADFKEAVHKAWLADWQPLEAAWVGLTEPPQLI